MSGGSQHNPNGRQSQLGPGWSPLQLQMANLLARAPQAHMASDRGVTWHTPTPPPHLYHVPAPSSPDPLQAMKNATSNSVFRHTTTPPELYRHTPTPPDKHIIRHTPSPGDVKVGAPLAPVELYPHLGPARDKMTRTEELLTYARVGVDLSLSGARAANGAASGGGGGVALSVRDAPTINSLIARSVPRHGAHARVDSLLERLVPSPVAPATPATPATPASPHSVIVHSRAAPTPSPPSSNEDSADSFGAPPGSKRKRKPERTLRVPLPPPISELARDIPLPPVPPARVSPLPLVPAPAVPTPAPAPALAPPLENGDAMHITRNGPDDKPSSPLGPERPHARRKTRSGSAETIDDIAAMIASTDAPTTPPPPPLESIALPETDAAVTVDNLKSVLASPITEKQTESESVTPAQNEEKEQSVPPAASTEGAVVTAAAPRRRSTRLSNSEAANVPVESPSEAKPAEPETGEAPGAEPTAASFVEVENQLEKMFAGLEEEKPSATSDAGEAAGPASALMIAKKRRKSAPARSDRRRARGEDNQKRKVQRKKSDASRLRKPKEIPVKDAYDSGSNASSSRSRGPYIQIRGPRDSPVSVSVMNASTGGGGGGGGGEEEEAGARRKAEEFRNGARTVRAARGLHASTLGLRYDATTPDLTWLCAFCQRGPHADSLGDLFGPYDLDTDCDEYRSMDESVRQRYESESSGAVWFHEGCGVWAPGLVAAGARVWGLAGAVWGARGSRCAWCQRAGAGVACGARGCPRRLHLPCATPAGWLLDDREFRALCPRHA